ncbi:MAG: aminomethyl-transferring glycine dehydrogenase subunit GcvPA [Nitrospirae bacterium]|nr:aminomethyl-transferring glycine dehydrogenase subunit GcvPA [Nitrospirota bacterium]
MAYVPNTEKDKREMLSAIGVDNIEKLLTDIPEEIRLKKELNLPSPLSEIELKKEMLSLSEKNADLLHYTSFLGAGAYDHYIPSVVEHMVSRSEFYTAYTPYQAEASQGMLQSIYEFQSMICELTGMEAANASMYDGASATAEAAMMAVRITKRKEILVSRALHPNYRMVLKTYLQGIGIPIKEITFLPVGQTGKDGITDADALSSFISDNTAAVIIQQPNFFGCIEDLSAISAIAKKFGALFIVSVDPISMGILKSPGELGADIVVGEGQALGNSLSFGGPYLGFFAARKEHVRQMPGRLVGATVDGQGKRGYCLTLQTREQHIKRERATSNICTNQALCALAATVYLSVIGKEGLRKVAELCLQKAHYAKREISKIKGFSSTFGASFFKEFVIKTPVSAEKIFKGLLKEKIIGGLELGNYYPELKEHLLICVTEKRTREEIERLINRMTEMAKKGG